MYDIGKFYQAADVEDAVRALVQHCQNNNE